MFGFFRAQSPTSLPASVPAAQHIDVMTDLYGRLVTYLGTLLAGEDQTNGLIGVGRKQVAVSTYSPGSTAATGALPGNIKASAGVLKRVTMSNFNAATRYLQVFNTTGAPSGVPTYSVPIPTSSMATLDFGEEGLYLSVGISIGFSTTAATYTAGAAGDVSYLVQSN